MAHQAPPHKQLSVGPCYPQWAGRSYLFRVRFRIKVPLAPQSLTLGTGSSCRLMQLDTGDLGKATQHQIDDGASKFISRMGKAGYPGLLAAPARSWRFRRRAPAPRDARPLSLLLQCVTAEHIRCLETASRDGVMATGRALQSLSPQPPLKLHLLLPLGFLHCLGI